MAQHVETVDRQTGEVTEFEVTETQSLAVALSRAEVDQQITTARAYPRASRKGGIRSIVNSINDLACLSEAAAAECVYALPRGGKPIRGPSVRLAEIVASQYGNARIGARVVHVDKFEKYVEAEGIFHDLETNVATTSRVRRRIVDKNGKLYNDDMILVTGNAAASIAKRNAIFGGVPKAIWDQAYKAADAVIAGDIKTLAVRRDEALKMFAVWGIKPEQIFASLEVEGLDDVGLDELATLRAIAKAIKDGEQKVEDYFPALSNGDAAVSAAKGTAAKMADLASGGSKPEGQQANDKPATDKGGKKSTKQKEGANAQDGAQQSNEAQGQDQGEAAGGSGAEGGATGGENVAGNDGTAAAERSGDGAHVEVNDEMIEAAFKRGEQAKADGVGRKAVPTEYRAEGAEALHDAWVRGWTGE